MLTIAVVAAVVLVAAYWFLARPVLAQWAAFRPFYDTLDDVEATLWFRVRMSIKGLKTILLNRLAMLATILVPLLQMTDTVDFTPLVAFLPALGTNGHTIEPTVYVPMVLSLLTFLGNNYLRKYATTTPVGSPVPEVPAVTVVPTVGDQPDAVVTTEGATVNGVEPKE